MEKAGAHQQYFNRYWNHQRQGLDLLIGLLRTATTEQCEIVATLFAAWNDLLLSGQTFSDDDIINEVLNNWHERKLRLDEDRLRRALEWMRKKELTPKGTGRPTIQKNESSNWNRQQ